MVPTDEGLGLDPGDVDMITLADGSTMPTHGPAKCLGPYCCIHNPSPHPLRYAPMHWSGDLRLMFRQCEHGALHPDPDALAFRLALALLTGIPPGYDGYHPCCPQQCCFDASVIDCD